MPGIKHELRLTVSLNDQPLIVGTNDITDSALADGAPARVVEGVIKRLLQGARFDVEGIFADGAMAEPVAAALKLRRGEG